MFAFYFGVSLLASTSITAIAFGLFGVFEIIAIFLLAGIIFRFGPVAYQAEYPLAGPPRHSEGKIIKLNATQIKFTAPDFCIFSPRIRLLPADFRYYWLVPLKGCAQFSEPCARVTVRRAVGPFGFLLAWLAAWSVGSLMVAAASESGSIDVFSYLLIGWIPCIVLLFMEKYLGRKFGESIANEVIAYLSQNQNQ